MSKFGTIGHYRIGNFYAGDMATALVTASALMLAAKSSQAGKRKVLTVKDPAKDDRAERQRWNDEVAAKKAAKKARP